MGPGRAGATGTTSAVPSLEADSLMQGSLPGGAGLLPAAAGPRAAPAHPHQSVPSA